MDIQYVAVKALILDESNRVLLLKQADDTISGDKQYHPPGGTIEPGETIETALHREIKEEIGVPATILRLVDIGEWVAERDNKTMQFIGIFYLCKIDSYDLKIQQSEASSALWVGVNDIDDYEVLEPSRTIIKELFAS